MGHTYAQLAAGFGIGTTTAYWYLPEAVELLAGLAPTLADAIRVASIKAFVILDGTLLPIDRIAADRPFYSGKHEKQGMNLQVRVRTAAAMSVMRFGLQRLRRKIRQDFRRATPRSAGARAWASARFTSVRSVTVRRWGGRRMAVVTQDPAPM
jgi:hypothetical protein